MTPQLFAIVMSLCVGSPNPQSCRKAIQDCYSAIKTSEQSRYQKIDADCKAYEAKEQDKYNDSHPDNKSKEKDPFKFTHGNCVGAGSMKSDQQIIQECDAK